MSKTLLQEGLAHLKKNRLDEAEFCFSEVLGQHTDHHYAINLLSVVAYKRQDFSGAIALLHKALELAPRKAMYHHNLAVMLSITGDFETSHEHFRAAIQNNPEYAEAYFNLAHAHKFEAGDPLIDKMESLLANNRLDNENLCFLHFAAGKIFDDIHDYDRAFEHYTEGNRLRKCRFSISKLEKTCDAIVSCFTSQLISKKRQAIEVKAEPIFIVGMPRSGTTLVEQILSSHSGVYGAGELNDMQSIAATISSHHSKKLPYPEYIEFVPDEILCGYANKYMQRTSSMAGPGQRVIDKMPSNFFRLGMIRMMFPGASLIHVSRDKIDTCLSCYFQRFTYRQDFSYSIENLAFYYRQYERLMQHWSALDLDFLSINYEDLVHSPEQETRKLLDYCGLEWEESCLEFYRTNRPVTTASSRQVRQPLYDSSLQRWRRYEKHLEPLIQALQ